MTQQRRAVLRALVLAGVLAPLSVAAQEAVRRAESPRVLPAAVVRRPTPAERTALRDQAQADSVVRLARAQLGRRYVFGGTTPSGFDCSGFLKYLMRALDRDLPRTAAEQARVGRPVPRDPRLLRRGDILTFGRGNRVTHVGIYVGDGRYIHASSGQGRIVESRLDRPQSALVRAWYGVRRLFSDGDSATAVAAASNADSIRRN